MRAVEGLWKIFVVYYQLGGTMRFAELQRTINESNTRGSITPKMLTQELREMEEDGLIHREVYLQVPHKVEYSLTALGRNLQPVVEAMKGWGRQCESFAEGGKRCS
ncbi:MAG: winged helix-turn-helix transcriptional regulator [Terracidiphilus sp.]|jgi:DNA-binding HxlR family transcriptional regulator